MTTASSGPAAVRHRILIAKPGLDGHNRGVHVLVRALRDAGFEVIYTGIRKTPEQIVEAAIQEDVRAIGVSSLSGAHMTLFPEIAERVARETPEVLLFCGGIIPDDDREALARCGYKAIFGPGTSTEDIIAWLRKQLGSHER
jgi:methylmalonyl-CoA mutase, C-terminal domain